MAATREDLKLWLQLGKDDSTVTHVVIVCDTFDYEDYGVYIRQDEDVKERVEKLNNRPMQRVMEVYSMSKDIDEQLAEDRSFNYE